MRQTLAVTPVPTSNTDVLLIGIFTTPSTSGGGGSVASSATSQYIPTVTVTPTKSNILQSR